MKKGILGIIAIFVMGIGFSSCESCMTCDIAYTKANGDRVNETTPQKCGFPGQLDDKEDNLKKAYSDFEDVDIQCDRQ